MNIVKKNDLNKTAQLADFNISTNNKATFFLTGRTGAEINFLVTPSKEKEVFIKHFSNSFYNTELAETLSINGIKHIIPARVIYASYRDFEKIVVSLLFLGVQNIGYNIS